MARRKRASLKDKGPETLGLTPKKGKGIDMLFGGPVDKKASASSESGSDQPEETDQSESEDIAMTTPKQSKEDSTAASPAQRDKQANDLAGETLVAPAIPSTATSDVIETLPVNEAADDDTGVIASSEEFDELGLPVAMEAPPSDLEFATMAPGSTVQSSETDPFDPSLSPFAAPPPSTSSEPGTFPSAVTDDDLSGLLEDDDLSGLLVEDDLSGSTAGTTTTAPSIPPEPAVTSPSAAIDDLSGLSGESGFSSEPETQFEPVTTPSAVPPANISPGPSASTAASADPFLTPSSVGTPFNPPPTPTAPAAGSTPGFTPPPPSTPPPPPSPVETSSGPSLPGAQVESLGGIITERIEVSDEDILPEDAARQVEYSNIIGVVDERKHDDRDQAKTAEVIRYIGRERRENLDREIERLYNEVAAELSVNSKDAEYALAKLSEAQDIIFEDARDYDRALYLVAVVKTMLARKRNLRRWSYTWGSFVFFYALVWLVAFVLGVLATQSLREMLGPASSDIAAVRAAWLSSLAGGIGGVIAILYSLYWRVAMKQDFDRQYIMVYLVRPIMGFILGAVIYFIIGAGFLVFNVIADPQSGTNKVIQSDTVVALQILTGWIAGFRQRTVFEAVDKLVQRFLGRVDEVVDDKPVSLAPFSDRNQTPGGES